MSLCVHGPFLHVFSVLPDRGTWNQNKRYPRCTSRVGFVAILHCIIQEDFNRILASMVMLLSHWNVMYVCTYIWPHATRYPSDSLEDFMWTSWVGIIAILHCNIQEYFDRIAASMVTFLSRRNLMYVCKYIWQHARSCPSFSPEDLMCSGKVRMTSVSCRNYGGSEGFEAFKEYTKLGIQKLIDAINRDSAEPISRKSILNISLA